jgi:hypothetical protein
MKSISQASIPDVGRHAEAYEAPTIEDVGSFVELTLGATGNQKAENVQGNSTGPA